MNLEGQVAIVTGAGRGIGREIAITLAKAGADVAVQDIVEETAQQTASDIKELGRRSAAIIGNVADKADVDRMIKETIDKLGKINILVNNAGITRDTFLVKMEEKQWDAVLTVNLKSWFLVTQAVAKIMIEKGEKGSFINISSVVGKAGNLGQCNYAASKAGAVGFTKTVAKEMARYGIRCNAIQPGFIRTPMTDAVPSKVIERMKTQIPLRRMGEPTEIANTVLFLASNDSSYITGAVIEVTGGLFM